MSDHKRESERRLVHVQTRQSLNSTGIAAEQRAKVVYEYLHRQINDKYVRETIDFLLNREEAHNALFREALNRVQHTGSNRDFGVTPDMKLSAISCQLSALKKAAPVKSI